MMVQSYFFVLLYILVLQRHVIYQKPGTFLKQNLGLKCQQSHGLFFLKFCMCCPLAISTKVCGENLFHFVLIYFISLHRKTKQKHFKMQEPGLFIFFLIPLDERKIKNLSPFATISKKITQTKFQRKIINLVALGLLQTSMFNRKKTQFLVNKTFLFKIICEVSR